MRAELDRFYAETSEYSAFLETSSQVNCWEPIRDTIESMRKPAVSLNVLEFGAGRTGFPDWLPDELRNQIYFVAQDITNQNLDFLNRVADQVCIGDLASIATEQKFDIIFSTFVWEHVSNPSETLEILLGMLNPHGKLFLFSPRYDIPFYVPPVLRHLSRVQGMLASLRLWLSRIRVLLGGKPNFWIVPAPAVLHCKKWFRDADAVHLVSKYDLQRSIGRSMKLTSIGENVGFLQRLTQLRVRVERKNP